MSGSAEVIAAMTAWGARKVAEVGVATQNHIRASYEYAMTSHPWVSRTGAAEGGFGYTTEFGGAEIVSTLYGAHPHDYYLENPNDNVNAYGNPAFPFHGRFRVIEAARDENIGMLWSEIQAIMSRL